MFLYLHVGLVVVVGHVPSVLLVIVVVSVRGVVGWGDGLCVGRSAMASIVEVDLKIKSVVKTNTKK